MRLLYGMTHVLMVELTERYQNSRFKLWLAEKFNATENPPSSNPFRIFLDYREIIETDDRGSATFLIKVSGIKEGIRRRMEGDPRYDEALEVLRAHGLRGLRPVMAILEADTYVKNGKCIERVPPSECASATSIEYRLGDIIGPELHLHDLY